MMAYNPRAASENEALRKAGGVFCKILGRKDIHADVMSTGEVFWEGSNGYKDNLASAKDFRAIYEKIRDRDRLKRGIKRAEKNHRTPPPPIKAPSTRRAEKGQHPDQEQLPLD